MQSLHSQNLRIFLNSATIGVFRREIEMKELKYEINVREVIVIVSGLVIRISVESCRDGGVRSRFRLRRGQLIQLVW